MITTLRASSLTNASAPARGFTLVELMIAITIGLIVSAGLLAVFGFTSSNRSELDRVSRLMENSRFAADILGDDLHHAGFYGMFAPLTSTAWRDDPSPCTIAVTDPTVLGWNATTTPVQMPAPIRGWDDPAAVPAELGCLDHLALGTDVIAVRRATSIPYASTTTNNSNLYVQSSQCVSDANRFLASNNVANLTLHNVACTATSQEIARFFTRAYFISTCNECNPSDGIPTLKRMEVRDGVVNTTALAEGVLAMEAEYGFDTNNDGVAETWLTTATTATGTATDSWSNVVGVRLHLLLRSTEPSPLSLDSASHTFNLGPDQPAQTCTPGYRCRTVTTTVRLDNVAGRREIP